MNNIDDETRKEREDYIITKWNGIYAPYEAFYIQSIVYAARQSEIAFSFFDTLIDEQERPELIFAAIQEALTHAGALSRFFWPAKQKNQLSIARCSHLRGAYKIDDTSPLKWRGLRNTIEHFDEKLDQYLLNDPIGCFFPSPVVGSCDLADDNLGNIFKLVDPEQGICVLLGEKFEFHPIRREVLHILTMSLQMDENGSRLKIK